MSHLETVCGGTDTETDIVYVSQLCGDTFRLRVEFGDAASLPMDVSAWEWLSQLRDDADAVVTDITIDETNAIAGSIEMIIAGSVTAGIPAGDYGFDLQTTDESDETRTLVTGRLRLKVDVSREVG